MAITEHYVTTTGSDTWANSTNPGTPCSLADALANAAAGDRVNVKAGTYSLSSFSPTNAGTANSPIIYRGYSSAIGDGYQGRTNGNGVLVTTNMPVFAMGTSSYSHAKDSVIMDSIAFTSTRTLTAFTASGANAAFMNCSIAGSGTGGASNGTITMSGLHGCVFNCDISNTCDTTLRALTVTQTSSLVLACRLSCTNGAAVYVVGGGRIVGCVIYGSTVGIANSGAWVAAPAIIGNTIVGNTNGIVAYTGSTTAHIINNLIADNTEYGIDGTDASGIAMLLAHNRFRNNGSGNVRYSDDWATATSYGHVTTGASSDFLDAGAGDYRLATDSPARAAGIPAYSDIGALQHADPAGGGGKFWLNMTGGFTG